MLLWRQQDLKIQHSVTDKSASELIKSDPGSKIVPTSRASKTKGESDESEKISTANDAIVTAIKTIAFSLSLPREGSSVLLGEGVKGGSEGVKEGRIMSAGKS